MERQPLVIADELAVYDKVAGLHADLLDLEAAAQTEATTRITMELQDTRQELANIENQRFQQVKVALISQFTRFLTQDDTDMYPVSALSQAEQESEKSYNPEQLAIEVARNVTMFYGKHIRGVHEDGKPIDVIALVEQYYDDRVSQGKALDSEVMQVIRAFLNWEGLDV